MIRKSLPCLWDLGGDGSSLGSAIPTNENAYEYIALWMEQQQKNKRNPFSNALADSLLRREGIAPDGGQGLQGKVEKHPSPFGIGPQGSGQITCIRRRRRGPRGNKATCLTKTFFTQARGLATIEAADMERAVGEEPASDAPRPATSRVFWGCGPERKTQANEATERAAQAAFDV